MISIVICSRNKQTLASVTQNVSETIGVPYEIIAIDNSGGKYGICAAYNLGASQAQFDLLCFMHEDLCFRTAEWGIIVAQILQDTTMGVLGVAGSTYQPKALAGGGEIGIDKVRMNVLQSEPGKEPVLHYNNPTAASLVEAATLDGLWLCCRKQVWEEFRFDESDFPGFHFYDIDFCTRVFTKYKNKVTFQVLIEHFSEGSFDKNWLNHSYRYYELRKSYLPFGVEKLSEKEKARIDLAALQSAAYKFIHENMDIKRTIALLKDCFVKDVYNKDTLWLLKTFVMRKVRNS